MSSSLRPVHLVVVVGGGPVGLTCAMHLVRCGMPVLLLEQRAPFEPPEPRANHVSARSMEILRQVGLAADVRAAGLPPDHPHDVVYVTRVMGRELGRVRIPPSAKRHADAGYADGGWPTPEPPHRINQSLLEPVLMQHAARLAGLTTRWNFRVDGVEPHGDFVRISGTDLSTGGAETIDARYVAACDGSRSSVRASIGVKFQGHDNLMRSMMATVTLPGFAAHERLGRGWMYWVMNPERSGCVMAIDGRERWIVNPFLKPGEDDASFDFEAATRQMLGIDMPFTVQFKKPWVGRRLLAERFSVGRVFLCGDAAHSWLPMAGYGMNAGIADAHNLAWKLAAVVKGWAGQALLDSYHDERHPVLEQVSAMVMKVRQNNAVAIPAEIDDDGPEGEAARARIGRFMMETDSAQFACKGLNFGYYYEHSAAVARTASDVAPAYAMGEYTASTVPGCRMPHRWLADGSSLYDAMGPGFALLRFDNTVPVGALQAAAQSLGIPLRLIELPREPADGDTPALVLVRPDQHVAWRGARVPAEAELLLARLLGTAEHLTGALAA